jgi:formiminotetrahydrofolate cyclodeaminase
VLKNLTISEFTAALASREPAPGGGSAAALAGLLGASLAEMAITLTRGRPEYAAAETFLAAKQAEVNSLRDDLLSLIDRDGDAFKAVIAAQALPEDNTAASRRRAAAIGEAIKGAAEVPLVTAGACLAVMEITVAILGEVNPHTFSDLGVGILASHTGLVGALYSTAINIGFLDDARLVGDYGDEVRRLRAAGDELLAAVQKQINGEPTFAVLRP